MPPVHGIRPSLPSCPSVLPKQRTLPSTHQRHYIPDKKYHIQHISNKLFHHYINMSNTQNEMDLVIMRK